MVSFTSLITINLKVASYLVSYNDGISVLGDTFFERVSISCALLKFCLIGIYMLNTVSN